MHSSERWAIDSRPDLRDRLTHEVKVSPIKCLPEQFDSFEQLFENVIFLLDVTYS